MKICYHCNGVIGDLNEPVAGTPCRCWQEKLETATKLGLLTGALKGLCFSVDAPTRLKIEEVLEKAGVR